MHRLVFLLPLVACAEPEPRVPGPAWEQRADLPARRLEASAAAVGTRLVVVGGFATGDREVPALAIAREVLQFDPFAEPADAWRVLPVEAPLEVTHAGLAGVGGSVYLLGGLTGTAFVPSAAAYRLAPGATAWEPLADLPEPRGAAAVVAASGHIFLIGGETAAGFTDTILDYEIASNTWTTLAAKLTTPRSHAAALREADGTLIVAGGIGPQGPLGDTAALRLGATVWEPREPMPTPRGGCAYGELYGDLVCAGGELGTAVTRAVEIYDPTEDTWTIAPELPAERAGAPGAVVASRLYVIGGSASLAFEPTATLYEFDVLATIPR